MNIIDNTKTKRPTVSVIAVGTVFKYDGSVFMKVSSNRLIDHNVQVQTPIISLSTGTLTMMDNSTYVSVVEAELHIK
jgi:hypothetical protein